MRIYQGQLRKELRVLELKLKIGMTSGQQKYYSEERAVYWRLGFVRLVGGTELVDLACCWRVQPRIMDFTLWEKIVDLFFKRK